MPGLPIPQLWSENDEANAQAFVAAVDTRRLEDALLAIEGARPGAVVQVRRALERWADEVRRERGSTKPRADAAVLRLVLGLRHQLRGDQTAYDDPVNSHLSQVVERRQGMPILLSSVWILVGRQAGIQVDGIGLPGHFIARIGGEGGVFVDPFDRGRVLTREQCIGMVSRLSAGKLTWNDRFLSPTLLVPLIERVLRNLCASHQRRRDFVSLFRAATLLGRLLPRDASVKLMHAQAAAHVGAPFWAMELYREVAEQFPGTRSETIAAERLALLESDETQLN